MPGLMVTLCTLLDLLPCERQTPCQNGGTCRNDGRGGYTCSCPPGWQGTNCQERMYHCLSNPCRNQGTCIVSSCHMTSALASMDIAI